MIQLNKVHPLMQFDGFSQKENLKDDKYRKFMVEFYETLSVICRIHPDTDAWLRKNELPTVFKYISDSHGIITFMPKENKVYLKNFRQFKVGITKFIREQLVPKSLIEGLDILQIKEGQKMNGFEEMSYIVEGWPEHWIFKFRKRFPQSGQVGQWLVNKRIINPYTYGFSTSVSDPATLRIGFTSKIAAKMFLVRLTSFLSRIDKIVF